jgi:hypothetical protein
MEGGSVKATRGIETRLRRASVLIAAGLLTQVLTFLIKHPLAFVAFLAVGCPLVAGGTVLFLLGLVSSVPKKSDAAGA